MLSPASNSGNDSASGPGPTVRGFQDAQWGALGGLWAVSGLDRHMKRLLPVDEIQLTTGRSLRTRRTTPRIILSKDLGGGVQAKYNGSLNEPNDHIVSLEYVLMRRATLQGAWTSVSDVPVGDLGLDLKLQWEFD